MEDTLISFKVANLLASKGFNIECNDFFFRGKSQSDIIFKQYVGNKYFIWQPTQSLAQKWLREVHNLNINIKHRPHSQSFCFNITGNYQDGESGELYSEVYSKYETYELALEAAIIKGLELIK